MLAFVGRGGMLVGDIETGCACTGPFADCDVKGSCIRTLTGRGGKASCEGIPCQRVIAGRVSPFINTESGPNQLPSFISVP